MLPVYTRQMQNVKKQVATQKPHMCLFPHHAIFKTESGALKTNNSIDELQCLSCIKRCLHGLAGFRIDTQLNHATILKHMMAHMLDWPRAAHERWPVSASRHRADAS